MISVYRKKEILNYHIVYGYGAKKIRTEMLKAGKKPASRGVIRRLINTYEHILKTQGLKAADSYYSKEEEFHTPQRERTKLDAKARQYIEDCLEENKRKIAEGNRKHLFIHWYFSYYYPFSTFGQTISPDKTTFFKKSNFTFYSRI